ncbi:PQQ-binding-like beta-propeller repeat protein [Streptomyces sp. NPDC058664]|uniref:outer membrane protein assembly factor BamB family protein n=1 Tax=unclassified Streptomyces TaxID=2593676 RepID=UPI003668CDF4
MTLAAPAGVDGPLIAAAHHQQKKPRSEFRLLSGVGEVLLRCIWHPYDRAEHVELSVAGNAFVATRTSKKPHLSGLSSITDRHVEIYSTKTGERVARVRTTDYVQDGARVYGRLGSEVFAQELDSGREAWRVDTSVRLGDPRRAASDPVFLAGSRVLVYAPADRTVVALDAATGRNLWRAAIPGPVQSVHAQGADRLLIHYHGGLAFTGPHGVERIQPVRPAVDGARQKLEDIVRTDDGVMAAVIDQSDRSTPVLIVTGDTPELAGDPLRIPIVAAHAQAILTDTVAYVLPWVPDGEQATLYAYDLTVQGRLLWQLPVPDRLTINQTPGPDSSLHPFNGGLFGLDHATGWILHPTR